MRLSMSGSNRTSRLARRGSKTQDLLYVACLFEVTILFPLRAIKSRECGRPSALLLERAELSMSSNEPGRGGTSRHL